MPGLGPRIWNAQTRAISAEEQTTVINLSVADAIALDGTTIPYNSRTGHMMVRMVGRAQKATRPLNVSVRWNGELFDQQAFHVTSGAGGTFVGIWTLVDQIPGEGDIVISCGLNNAGCTAIRVGELAGDPYLVAGTAMAGYSIPYEMTASAIVVVGGVTDEEAFAFTSPDFETQWGIMIPQETSLPNRTKGLSAYFGATYSAAKDGRYDIIPRLPINGVIAIAEIRL